MFIFVVSVSNSYKPLVSRPFWEKHKIINMPYGSLQNIIYITYHDFEVYLFISKTSNYK